MEPHTGSGRGGGQDSGRWAGLGLNLEALGAGLEGRGLGGWGLERRGRGLSGVEWH